MVLDKQAFFNRIAVSDPSGWTKRDAEELCNVLLNKVMVRALTRVHDDYRGGSERFRSLDFTKQEDVAQGIKQQGRGEGMLHVLEVLADLAGEVSEDGG